MKHKSTELFCWYVTGLSLPTSRMDDAEACFILSSRCEVDRTAAVSFEEITKNECACYLHFDCPYSISGTQMSSVNRRLKSADLHRDFACGMNFLSQLRYQKGCYWIL